MQFSKCVVSKLSLTDFISKSSRTLITNLSTDKKFWSFSIKLPDHLSCFPSRRSAVGQKYFSLEKYFGGLKWTRTTDLTLIRRAL